MSEKLVECDRPIHICNTLYNVSGLLYVMYVLRLSTMMTTVVVNMFIYLLDISIPSHGITTVMGRERRLY